MHRNPTPDMVTDGQVPDHVRITHVGECLYGANWKKAMAADLGVSDQNVRDWAFGRRYVPTGVWGELRDLVPEALRRVTMERDAIDRRCEDLSDLLMNNINGLADV